tara:strand:+ start:94 stop:288 length:195 start_codon:yes stop_codon:yes gene_type:complete
MPAEVVNEFVDSQISCPNCGQGMSFTTWEEDAPSELRGQTSLKKAGYVCPDFMGCGYREERDRS